MDPALGPSVRVVIVNYNNAACTIRCLRSLDRIEQPPVRPIVVDNASSDGSVKEIQSECPEADVIVASANRGFGAGNNLGITAALRGDSPYVWLLNNDTEVDPNCLRLLIAKAEDEPAVGVVGAMVYDLDDRDRVQVVGGGYVIRPLALTRHHRSAGRSPGFVTGVSMLVRREVFEATHGFDERFFLYCEDVDFCVRTVAAGWQLAVEPEARVWHQGGATTEARGSRRSPSMERVFASSTALFIRKHAGTMWLPWLAARAILMFVRRLTPQRVHMLGPMIRGLWEGARRLG